MTGLVEVVELAGNYEIVAFDRSWHGMISVAELDAGLDILDDALAAVITH